MEILLNLAWLLVAVVCAFGLLRRARREPDSANMWLLATAVLCIVVLLFPVISMTDDLHAEVFTAEESGKRRIAAVQIQQQLTTLCALVSLLAGSLITLTRLASSTTEETIVLQALAGIRHSSFSRPPPRLALA